MLPYSRPPILFNPHLETVYPSLMRKVELLEPRRERIMTPDDDFLDLDWYQKGASRCVVISHGLEGNSNRAYMKGMAKAFFFNGYDAVAWNYRGCSGEVNKQLRFYHSGATDDLQTVVDHVSKQYEEVFLIGFSLGGNLTLKYLGEPHVNPSVKKAVTFSVPLNLHSSCLEISKPGNWIYNRRFLSSLRNKVKMKAAVRRELDLEKLAFVTTLLEFDDTFTGPIHGFQGAIDYYTQCSSLYFLEHIKTPTLVVNALNDPFLSEDCYPTAKFNGHPYVTFEFPTHGGHVGFTLFNEKGLYWSEMRALHFMEPR